MLSDFWFGAAFRSSGSLQRAQSFSHGILGYGQLVLAFETKRVRDSGEIRKTVEVNRRRAIGGLLVVHEGDICRDIPPEVQLALGFVFTG